MAQPEGEAKHAVIIDADLHVQDPHEIILSYFNTSNESQFVQGKKKEYKHKLIGLFVGFVLMKFFFQEMFTGFLSFVFVLAVSLVLGFVLSEAICFFVKIFQNSCKTDVLRGLFFQITFITIIVVVLGMFI